MIMIRKKLIVNASFTRIITLIKSHTQPSKGPQNMHSSIE